MGKVFLTIDWVAVGAVTSAASTLILTFITAYYAWSTRQILAATARQAAAAERTVDLVAGEQRRRFEQCRAPIHDGIKRGEAIVEEWLQIDFQEWQAPNTWPESRDLELPELSDLISQARDLWFPLSVALSQVETQIVKARHMIDELSAAPDESAFLQCAGEAREELLQLRACWTAADAELASWQ